MEKFDGFTVDKYSARLSGAFDLTPDEGDRLRYGETVVFVGVATVGPATFNETRGGDIARTNVLKPREVVLVPADRVQDVLVELGIPTQLTLDRPSDPRPTIEGGSATDVVEPEVSAGSSHLDEEEEEEDRELVAVAVAPEGRRQHPTPSTVGASQAERDPMLANFLAGR